VCPACRGICNCSTSGCIRKRAGWDATKSIERLVWRTGYDSAAHCLVTEHQRAFVDAQSASAEESVAAHAARDAAGVKAAARRRDAAQRPARKAEPSAATLAAPQAAATAEEEAEEAADAEEEAAPAAATPPASPPARAPRAARAAAPPAAAASPDAAAAAAPPPAPEALVGTTLRKCFRDGWFAGKVMSYDAERRYFKIVYSDGDGEEMSASDLRRTLRAMASERGSGEGVQAALRLRSVKRAQPAAAARAKQAAS
jgi:hypothetical protein